MRRARVLIHLAVLVLLPIAARANDDPVFDSPAMRVCFVDLLRKVGWGLAGPFERAAFVIEGEDGSLSCDPWPSTHGYLAESFHGIVPAHAIAIVHTHPVRFPMPSQQDQDDATRLRIPNYVVSVLGVYKSVPGGVRGVTVTAQRSWIREVPLRAAVSGSATAGR